jgi:hypothetical protein
VYIDKSAQPRFPAPDDPKFGEVEAYINAISKQAGLNALCKREGAELVLI